MTKVIKGGTVCTADRAYKADVLIEDEIIKQIGQDLKGDEYIDAEGAYVIPGGIDPHTHLEMPLWVLLLLKHLKLEHGLLHVVVQQ
jgi:dihydropyrimidinase